MRAQAAKSLGEIAAEPGQVVPLMVKALERDDEPEVRRAAVSVLAAIGPEAQDAVPVLFQMMNRRYESFIAYGALKQILPRSVPLLRETLRHRSRFARGFAAERLGELGAAARDALPDLRDALEERRVDPRLERRLREALRRIRTAVEREPEPKLRVF